MKTLLLVLCALSLPFSAEAAKVVVKVKSPPPKKMKISIVPHINLSLFKKRKEKVVARVKEEEAGFRTAVVTKLKNGRTVIKIHVEKDREVASNSFRNFGNSISLKLRNFGASFRVSLDNFFARFHRRRSPTVVVKVKPSAVIESRDVRVKVIPKPQARPAEEADTEMVDSSQLGAQ